AVPAPSARRVEALGMPEDREAAAMLRRPVEQLEDAGLRCGSGETLVAILGERGVHNGQRHLHEVRGPVALEVPGTKGVRDPGAGRAYVPLDARSGAAHADPRPAPRHVDVVRERDREPGASVPRRRQPELAAETLERRIEGVENGRRGEKAPVAVARAGDLLD